MLKEQLKLLNANRDREQLIYVPSLCSGRFILFEPGTGDNLLPEDFEEGFVDYINYTVYVVDDGPAFVECDGGMVLLRQCYGSMRIEDILEALLEEVSYPAACPDVEEDNIIAINRTFEGRY